MSGAWVSRLLLTGLVAVTAARADEWTHQWQVSGRPELVVDSNDASVVVRPGGSNRIEARVTTVGYKLGPGEVKVTERQSGNRVELEVRLPQRHWGINWSGNGSRSVNVELQVPASLNAKIHTGDGSVRVSGLSGELRLSTGDGRIEATDVSGNLDAKTGDGSIRVRGRYDSLLLDTGDGSIEADVMSGSRLNGNWRVHSGDGHVTLRLPDGLAATIDARTGDGSIRTDMPVAVEGEKRRHELVGKLNGGGPTLVVRTGDGSIHLARI